MRKTMPKVSVIVPVYRVEKYIERCVRSLFEQTLDDIEYLFIDDCTPDRSIEILKQVLKEYPQRKAQVIIHCMEKNSGQAKVREWGIKNATGEYVIHCDSDDWVDTDMYRAMYEKAIVTNADILRCNFVRVSNKSRILCEAIDNKILMSKKELISCLLLGKDLSSTCDKLVKRELYNLINFPQNNMWEDFYMILQLFFYSRKTVFIPDVFYFYYQNLQSICGSLNKESAKLRFDNERIALDNILKFLEREKLINGFKNEIANLKMHIKEELIQFMNDKDVKNLWNKSFPEIGYSYLVNPTIRRNSKIKYLLCDCGLNEILRIFKR